jgi:anti-sigma regulatory factor (Ser/Thr protein kinase)
MTSHRSFPATPESIREARRFVLDQLAEVPRDTRDQVSLIVSELVTNAIVHAATGYTVALNLDAQTLTLEVADRGDGRPSPADAPPPAEQQHGRGLLIVTELADEWGVIPNSNQPGKTVWVKLPLSPGGRRARTEPAGDHAREVPLPSGSTSAEPDGSESTSPTAGLKLADDDASATPASTLSRAVFVTLLAA